MGTHMWSEKVLKMPLSLSAPPFPFTHAIHVLY